MFYLFKKKIPYRERNTPANAVVFRPHAPAHTGPPTAFFLQVFSQIYICKLAFYKFPTLPHALMNWPHDFPFLVTS